MIVKSARGTRQFIYTLKYVVFLPTQITMVADLEVGNIKTITV